jgi:hypothetical protein
MRCTKRSGGGTGRFDMRLRLKVAIAALLPLALNAEVICALGPGAGSYKASSDERPTGDAMELARKMNDALSSVCAPKCPQIAIFRNATAANAMLVFTNDEARVVYAPQFFSAVYEKFGDGAIVAILAHEFGHALDEVYRVSWVNRSWPVEARADAWAGCALARSRLSARDLKEALTAMEKYPSPAHPAWPLRLTALRSGYTNCGGDGARFDGEKKGN